MADLQTIHQQSNYLVSVVINLEKHVPYAYKGGNRRDMSPSYVRDATSRLFRAKRPGNVYQVLDRQL